MGAGMPPELLMEFRRPRESERSPQDDPPLWITAAEQYKPTRDGRAAPPGPEAHRLAHNPTGRSRSAGPESVSIASAVPTPRKALGMDLKWGWCPLGPCCGTLQRRDRVLGTAGRGDRGRARHRRGGRPTA